MNKVESIVIEAGRIERRYWSDFWHSVSFFIFWPV